MTKTETGAFRSPQAALRALELIGKESGMFVERKQVTNDSARPFSHMSDEELKRSEEELAERIRRLERMRRMISSTEN
jgi:hypothetical protein